MAYQQLTIDQIKQLNEITDPIARRRFGILFQLPQDIQDIFVSDDSTNSIWNITKGKYNLATKDISATARIIGLILLGELPIKNFIVALQNDLDIDLETAQAMAQDINIAIFQPIRESLMFVHNIGGKTGVSDTNLRMRANDANKNAQAPNYKSQIPNSGQRTADRMQIPNQQTPIRETYRADNQMPRANSNQQPNLKDEYYDYEIQRKREEIINRNKIRTQQQPPPPPNNQQARPAMLRMLPKKNIVDLRVLAKKKYKKNHYDGFFSA